MKMVRMAAIVALVGLVVLSGAASAQTVHFNDNNLKQAVKDKLGITTDPTQAQMASPTFTSLDAFSKGITDLTGLEYATNLQSLDLSDNAISDISPLGGLTNLKFIHLGSNQISDISPLRSLTNLKVIYLDSNQINDISPLEALNSLLTLILHGNQISDISPLGGLPNLQALGLIGNQISDISFLAGLTTLIEVGLQDNPLHPDACTKYIPQMESHGTEVVHDDCWKFVPNYVGMSLEQAEQLIYANGWSDAITYVVHAEPAGQVIDQDPPKDGLVPPSGDVTIQLTVSSGSGGPVTPSTGCLAAHWKLDETSGTTAADASGNKLNGTLSGGPTWQTTGGKVGGALQFDGVNDYIDCGNPTALNIQDKITLACWIKLASFTRNWQAILAKGDNSYRLTRSSAGNSVYFGLGGTSVGGFDGATEVANNEWHHIAGVYDGANATLYIDGTADTAVPSTGKISTNSYNLFIGENSQARARYFKGLMDDVRIYSCALTEAEVVAAMRGTTSPTQVQVPNVVGMAQATAQTTITSAGLVVGTVTQASSTTVAQGKVISQNPAAGTSVAGGSSVSLVVSSGPVPPTTVQVPNVMGKAQAAAQTTITSAGLIVGTVTEASTSTVALGNVISQNPASGTSVARGSSVNLVVASGPSVGPGNAGLIARWKLDETSGTLASDSAGTNKGTLRNGPVWQPTGGKFKGALSFDGVDDYVDCGNGAVFNLSQQVTLAAWINTQDGGTSVHHEWVCKGDHTYAIKYNGLNQVETFICDPDSGWITATYNAGSSFNNAWHHVAGTYDGSSLKLYVDGALQATTPHVGHIETTTHNLYIGANSEMAGRNSHSLLDDVRIYGCALTAAEVGLLAGKPPAEPNLVGWWKLDESAGTVVYDSAGMNDGTTYGGPLWQPTGGKSGGGLKLDGVNDYVQLPIGPVIKSLTNSTFAVWVNWSGTGGDWQRIFDFGSGTNAYMFLTPRTDTGLLCFGITNAGNTAEDRATAPQVLATGWHHVAVTIDAASKTDLLYLDGQLVATKTSARYTPSSLGNTTQNWLGWSQWKGTLYFNGSLDDLRIYNRVLSAQEIQQCAGIKSGGPNR